MVGYIVRRLVWFVPIVLITLTILFFVLQVLPGDPIRAAYGDQNPLSPDQIAALRAQLGLDQPVHVRYFNYLMGIFRLDLGVSFYTTDSVVTQIATRLPVTMGLVTLAMLMVLLLSVPLGILSGYYHDKWPDWLIRPLMVFFIGVPEFWVGCILIMVLLIVWHWSVPLSYVTFFSNPVEAFQQYIFPSMLLALRGFGTGARMIRSSLIETMEEDYIRTARAKGLTETLVTLRHGLPNSLVPVVTFYGLQIIILVGATTVIETLFGMPGIGSMIVRSAQSHDTYVLQGGIMILLIVALVMNLIIDLLYAKLDPRVRYE